MTCPRHKAILWLCSRPDHWESLKSTLGATLGCVNRIRQVCKAYVTLPVRGPHLCGLGSSGGGHRQPEVMCIFAERLVIECLQPSTLSKWQRPAVKATHGHENRSNSKKFG